MPTITCPDCGQVTEVEALRRGADEFCSHCDYPLFWARVDGGTFMPVEDNEATRRRLPGTGGRMTVGSRVCPVCAEQNPLSRTHCLRCGSLLDPPPPEEPVIVEELPPPPPPPEPEPVVEVKRPWWPWALVAAVVVAIVVVIILTG